MEHRSLAVSCRYCASFILVMVTLAGQAEPRSIRTGVMSLSRRIFWGWNKIGKTMILFKTYNCREKYLLQAINGLYLYVPVCYRCIRGMKNLHS